MRILAYLWSYPPHRYVGGELMTADLLEYLVKDGHTVTVYADQVVGEYERNGVRIVSSDYLSKRIADTYDVFITHPEIRICAWAYVQDLPYIAIIHNVEPATMRSLERAAPTLTIANSEYTKFHIPLAAHNSKMGIEIIYPPVTITPQKGKHTYISMINISLEKGGSILNYVANKHPDIKYLGVQGGHGLQVYQQPKNVVIRQQTHNMAEVYADTKILLFPTHNDTYGKVIAEASQFGIPIITSQIGGVMEAIGDAALYLDPYDYDGWSEAISFMLEPENYKEYQRRSQERGEMLLQRSDNDLEKWLALVKKVCKVTR